MLEAERTMKKNEFKQKTKAELNELLLSLLKEQFQMRMNKGAAEKQKTHLFKNVRRDIARVKTLLNA